MICSSRFRYLALAAVFCVAAAGCGERSRGNVAGKVTFEGQPVTEGQVVFASPENGWYIPAVLGPDGAYSVRTANGTGLPTGLWQVYIVPPRMDPPVNPSARRAVIKDPPNIPRRYRDPKTSEFGIMVQESNPPFDFAMKR